MPGLHFGHLRLPVGQAFVNKTEVTSKHLVDRAVTSVNPRQVAVRMCVCASVMNTPEKCGDHWSCYLLFHLNSKLFG